MDKEQTIKTIFTFLAIIQGCLVLGLTIYIFGYYVPKKGDQIRSWLRWHVITVASSYILLTMATIKTAAMGSYNWGDWWYWMVSLAYVTGDISLVFVFKEAVRKHKLAQSKKI